MTDKKVEKWKEEPEELDLDVITNKKSKTTPVHNERGDFLTSSDTIEDFLELNKLKTAPSEAENTIRIPERVFKKLDGEGSKFEQLQVFILERNKKMLLGRIFNDLKEIVSTGNRPEDYRPPTDAFFFNKAMHSLKDSYWLLYSDIETKTGLRLDELEERAAFLEAENIVLRKRNPEMLKEERDAYTHEINALREENARLKPEIERLTKIEQTLNSPETIHRMALKATEINNSELWGNPLYERLRFLANDYRRLEIDYETLQSKYNELKNTFSKKGRLSSLFKRN